MRDNIVWAICNWLLRHVATDDYEDEITTVVNLGMEEYGKLSPSDLEYHRRVAELDRLHRRGQGWQ